MFFKTKNKKLKYKKKFKFILSPKRIFSSLIANATKQNTHSLTLYEKEKKINIPYLLFQKSGKNYAKKHIFSVF